MKGFYFWYAVAAILVGTTFNYYWAGQGMSGYSGGTSGGTAASYRNSGGGSHK